MFSLAKHYVVRWKYNVVYLRQSNTPVTGAWSEIADAPMSENDVYSMYLEARRKLSRDPSIVAVVTGPYQERIDTDWFNIVIDVDDLGVRSPEEKREVERLLARDGYVVVSTKRGLHIHARIPRSERVYAVSVVRQDERAEKAGEGAALQKHLWNSPPSRKPLATGWYTYAFVLPDGRRFARYDLSILKDYEPPLVSLEELESSLDAILGYRLVKFSPIPGAPPGARTLDGEPVRHKPVFHDIEEFLARAPNLLLPTPVARVLYNYYRAAGAPALADLMAVRNPYLARRNLLGPVPRGERFLVAAEFSLYVAHLTAWVRWSDLVEILAAAIEDWPDDDGAPLDRKLQYLFLFDETRTYVYPRYNGLGSLRPVSYCGICVFKAECDRRVPPWTRARKIIKKLEVARKIRAV